MDARKTVRDVVPDRWAIRYLTGGRHHTWRSAARAVTGTRTVTPAGRRRRHTLEQKRQRARERRQRAEQRRARRQQASGRPKVDGRRRGKKQEPDTLGAYLKAQ